MKDYRTYWLIGLVFAGVLFFFSGNTVETLEQKDYIMAMGFELSEEGTTVTFESPVLKKDEAQSVLDNGQQVKQLQVDHFKDFVEDYNSQNAKVLDLHHMKVIIIGKNLLNDKEKFPMFLDFLQKQNEFAENIFVAIDGSDGQLFNEDDESLGNYLETLIEKRSESRQQMAVTIGKLLSCVYNKNQALFVPVISKDRTITEECVVACGKPVKFITEDEAEWYMTANCIDCGYEIYFQDVYLESLEEEQNFSIEISGIERQVSFSEKEDKIFAEIHIRLKGNGKDYNGNSISDTAERYDKEQLLAMCLTEKMKELAEKSKGVDLFNTYYELSTKSRGLWEKYQDDYDGYVSKLQTEITVSVDFTE